MPDIQIVLHDIPGKAATDKSWSPNVWKTRFVLNYKKISHKTSWVEYPDVGPLCQKLGAPPSTVRQDGSPYYTVPFLYDPKTSIYVSDSLTIAKYLESTYPEAPKLFPTGTYAAIQAFDDLWQDRVVRHFSGPMVYAVFKQLSDDSKAYFRTTREARYKTKLENLAPSDKQPALWNQVRLALGQIDTYMKANGKGATFWFGDKMTYADVVIAGWLVWIKRVMGPDSVHWRELTSWHGGRWGKLMKEFEKWEYVDHPRRSKD